MPTRFAAARASHSSFHAPHALATSAFCKRAAHTHTHISAVSAKAYVPSPPEGIATRGPREGPSRRGAGAEQAQRRTRNRLMAISMSGFFSSRCSATHSLHELKAAVSSALDHLEMSMRVWCTAHPMGPTRGAEMSAARG